MFHQTREAEEEGRGAERMHACMHAALLLQGGGGPLPALKHVS